MKNAFVLTSFILLCPLALVVGQLMGAGSSSENQILDDYYMLQHDCAEAINEQIGWELYASIVYLNMAAYFDRPSVAKTGYSKFFKDQSLEEYEHASKFIEYVNLRNATVKRIAVSESPKNEWSSPREALTDAIKLEKHVFAKIQYIHDVAEAKCRDAHLTDFLEGNFFTEQVESIRELQTMLTKISIHDSSARPILEYLEDKELRKGK